MTRFDDQHDTQNAPTSRDRPRSASAVSIVMSWVCTSIALVACASTPAGTNSTSSNDAGSDTGSDASGDGDADAGTTAAGTSADDGASDDGSDGCSDLWGCPMCNPWDPDCPDGEKCTPVRNPNDGGWDGNFCVPAGDQPIGAPCSFVEDGVNGQDTCAAPGFCWGLDWDTGIGRCIEQCSGPQNAASCPITGVDCTYGTGSGILNICLPTCDPLVDPCWEGTLCVAAYTGDAEGPDRFVCVTPGTWMPGGPGDPCTCANCCQTGTLCEDPNKVGLDNCPDVDPASQGCCTAICDINLPDPDLPCAEAGLVGTVCVAFYPPGTPEPLGKLGKCVLP